MSTNDYYLPQTFYPNDERITQRTHRSYWQGPLFDPIEASNNAFDERVRQTDQFIQEYRNNYDEMNRFAKSPKAEAQSQQAWFDRVKEYERRHEADMEAQKNAFIASCQQRLGSRTAGPSYAWQHTPTRQRASSFTPTGNSYARYQDSIQTPVLQQHNSQPFFDQFSYGSPQFSTTGGTLDGGSVNGFTPAASRSNPYYATNGSPPFG